MYFARNWEFGLALSKLRNFGGDLNTPSHRYATETHLNKLKLIVFLLRTRGSLGSNLAPNTHYPICGYRGFPKLLLLVLQVTSQPFPATPPPFHSSLIVVLFYVTRYDPLAASLNTQQMNKFVSVHPMKAYRGSWDTAPLILNLNIRWRWLVKFMPLQLYFSEKPSVSIGVWMGPKDGRHVKVEEKNLLPLLGFEPRTVQSLASLNTQ
jgi:hypothetical protein